MERFLAELGGDEAGATAIEYALIGTLVSVGCVVGLLNFQSSMDVLYNIVEAISAVF